MRHLFHSMYVLRRILLRTRHIFNLKSSLFRGNNFIVNKTLSVFNSYLFAISSVRYIRSVTFNYYSLFNSEKYVSYVYKMSYHVCMKIHVCISFFYYNYSSPIGLSLGLNNIHEINSVLSQYPSFISTFPSTPFTTVAKSFINQFLVQSFHCSNKFSYMLSRNTLMITSSECCNDVSNKEKLLSE